MTSLIKKFGIQTQITLIVGLVSLCTSGLFSFFAIRSANTHFRREAISSVGIAADHRREMLLTMLESRQQRAASILAIAKGICAKNTSYKGCIEKIFRNFAAVNQVSRLEYQSRKHPSVAFGVPASFVAKVPHPLATELSRFGRGPNGKVYFTVRAINDGDELDLYFPGEQLQSIFSNRRGLGNSGETFLTDEHGLFLTASRYPSSSGVSHPIQAKPMNQCLSGHNEEVIELDYRDHSMVHGYRFIPEIGGGCLMAHIDESELFASTTRVVRAMLSISALGLLFATLLALLLARLVTRPIERLYRYAQAVQCGDYASKCEVEGPREIQAFANVFSRMTESLIREIEDRKRFQFESDRQRSQFEAIFNSMSDAVMFTDHDRRIQMVNPAFHQIFGLSDVVGQSECILYSTEAEFADRAQKYSETESAKGQVVGIAFRRANGESFASETRISKVYDMNGVAVGWIAIIRDISSVKLAQARLQESEARFRRAIIDAPIPIMIGTVDGEVLEISRTWTEVTGYSLAEISTIDKWIRLAYGSNFETAQKRIAESVSVEQRFDLGEFEVNTKFGTRVFWHFVVSPLGTLSDGRKLVISMANDVTERRRAEIELSKAIASRDEFLATLSHELRTPMNIILGWLDILTSEQCDQKQFKEALEILKRNASIQQSLIDDLLDVSRIISGKFHIEKAPTDLGMILRETCNSLRFRADEKHIQFTYQIPDRAVMVFGDPGKLVQVVTNLLQNALKFTPQKGYIFVSLQVEGGVARLLVRDNGVGITEQFLPHIFDRLQQENMGTTRSHAGLGLGLAISRHIIENHGGQIKAFSLGRNQGTTMEVTMPLQKSIEADEGNNLLHLLAQRSDNLRGLKILIVDDSPDIILLLRTWLEHEGMIVHQASSAAAALKILKSTTLDLVISDIGMPEQDGYQLIKEIRRLPGPQSQIPAVALTAYARADDRMKALHAGFQIHISKPASKASVIAAVHALLRPPPIEKWETISPTL
jgi:PAS domain S-box-containing protein